MKRRNFLSATGVVIAAGMTSSVSAAGVTFNAMSSHAALNEFSDTAKAALENFKKGLKEGLCSFPDAKKLLHQTAMPVRIISKKSEKNLEQIIYKNQNGQYVRLTSANGSYSAAVYIDAIFA